MTEKEKPTNIVYRIGMGVLDRRDSRLLSEKAPLPSGYTPEHVRLQDNYFKGDLDL